MRTLAALLSFACFANAANAVVIHVEADGSGDVPTIAAAYAIALSGDDIELGPGTYFEHDIVMKSSVDLRGVSGDPSDTIVDAQGLGRCLVGAGVTGNPQVVRITFQNGVHAVEGGILLAGQGGTGGGHNTDYVDCVFRNGSAPNGGAVATRSTPGSSPDFVRCLFESNEATAGDGGAAWCAGNAEFTDSRFDQNQASGRGGAVFTDKDLSDWGTIIEGTVFEENAAGGDGGAVYSKGTTSIYGTGIMSCRFVANTAANGGAAHLTDYDVVSTSLFFDNVAVGDGGALRLLNIQPDKDNLGFYVWNVFAGNQAGANGGAMHITGPASFTLRSCTFAANGAPSGGHIWTTGTPTIRSSILAFATAGGAAAGAAVLVTTCSDVYGNVGGDYVGPLVAQGGHPTNLSEDPLFCDLAALDLTLRETSPCLPPLPVTCDAGGVNRIGTYGQGCTAVNVDQPEAASWGRIKSIYR